MLACWAGLGSPNPPSPGVRGVHVHHNNEDGELGAGQVVRNSAM